MAILGEIRIFFADKAKTKPVLPRTKTKAVSDDNNVSLDVLLGEKASTDYVDAEIAGTKPVLLWENASPTSEFGEQTVTLDLTDYSGVQIVYVGYTSNPMLLSTGYLPKESIAYEMVSFTMKTDNVDADIAYRKFTMSDNGITFYTPYYNDLKGSDSLSGSNKSNIPYKIYGIK